MTQAPAKDVTAYTHELIQFENENGIFFRNGKFIDNDGIEAGGNDILVKGFINKEKMGVVVWNKNMSEKRDFSVSVPGYHLTKAAEPGKPDADAYSPLNANSLRLLIFEKN